MGDPKFTNFHELRVLRESRVRIRRKRPFGDFGEEHEESPGKFHFVRFKVRLLAIVVGYEIFIIHAKDSPDTARHPISEELWQRLISEDSSLALSTTDYYDRRMQDGAIERFHPALWTAHPDSPSLWFIDGAIQAKSPDDSTMIKMIELANKLGARVLDEDGGTYTLGPNGEVLFHPPE